MQEKTELCKTIFGAYHKSGGTLTLNGRELKIKNPSDAVKNRIALVPEERRKEGVLVAETVTFNISAACLGDFCTMSFVNDRKTAQKAKEYVKSLSIKTPSVKQRVAYLSGGNQQKVAVAKWLAADCDVYIFDEPTSNLDSVSKKEFYDMIEHTFDMAEQWGFFRRSRRMKPAWTIRTEYRKLRLPLDFYLPLSVGWSEYRETSSLRKKVYRTRACGAVSGISKGDGRKIDRKRCTYYGK